MSNETNEISELASRWKRLGGSLLDGLITMAIILPVMVISGVFAQITQKHGMSIGQQVLFFCFAMVVSLLVNGYFLAKHGQTVGKKLVGTRIVSNESGQLLTLEKVFGLRFVLPSLITQIPIVGGIFAVLDSLFIFQKNKRCIHDLIAGTKVVKV